MRTTLAKTILLLMSFCLLTLLTTTAHAQETEQEKAATPAPAPKQATKAKPAPDPLALTDKEVGEYRQQMNAIQIWAEDMQACKQRGLGLDVKDSSGFEAVGRQFREVSQREEVINQNFANWLTAVQRSHNCAGCLINRTTLRLEPPKAQGAPPAAPAQ